MERSQPLEIGSFETSTQIDRFSADTILKEFWWTGAIIKKYVFFD